MPNTLGRNLNLCFTKITRPLTLQSPDNDHSRPLPTTAADGATATTSTSSTSLMIKNFNSLYDDQYMFDSTTTSKSLSSSVSSSETDTDAPAADFATAFASRRFFFSSPGRSNSIVDQSASSPSSIAASSESPNHKLVNHSVAVPTFSPDPYRDFRRSMQEMVEAREGMNNEEEEEGEKKKSNWEFLHELLLCYLALNPKSTHKFIIGAFADLLVSLMPSPGGGDRRELPEFTAGVCEISRCV
ncbi:transcription repressor OFP12-like [Prunus avium]|uniref:Transcription repressor n=1 Tax=Prunus avium TaxID=42229 RepID=A0A6P5RVJ5_PRUAV|nr:transcription repressor OFP12-like [Prunus avium]